jgi:hypothetical protein
VLRNILTSSAKDDIYINISYIKEKDDGKIEFDAQIEDFDVQTYDRADDTTYKANFGFYGINLQEAE